MTRFVDWKLDDGQISECNVRIVENSDLNEDIPVGIPKSEAVCVLFSILNSFR